MIVLYPELFVHSSAPTETPGPITPPKHLDVPCVNCFKFFAELMNVT